MIWLLIAVVLLIAAIVHHKIEGTRNWDTSFLWLITSVCIGIVWFTLICGFTGGIIHLNEDLIAEQQNLVVYEDEYRAISETLLSHLERYPQEKEMFAEITPTFLLKLPEIKSDKVLVGMAEKVIARQRHIYICKRNINKTKATLRKYDHPWIVPTLIRPKPEGLDAEK